MAKLDPKVSKTVEKLCKAFKKPINFMKLGGAVLKNREKLKKGNLSIDTILDIVIDAQ